ncbi:hypothetical protein L596_002501 [Steinernema carpocapsae]|uniref:Uncharacterized protein n=1 Tax=Steinernema carpocapsae TaxID=34508 RepID=A0A4U8UR95_STECR|nr:hypothetical protein L596_002501 [Steinernema carpocapsae]
MSVSHIIQNPLIVFVPIFSLFSPKSAGRQLVRPVMCTSQGERHKVELDPDSVDLEMRMSDHNKELYLSCVETGERYNN